MTPIRPRPAGFAAAALLTLAVASPVFGPVLGLVLSPVTGHAATAPATDPVVARLDGADIHASEVRRYVDALDPAARQQAASDPRVLMTLVRAEMGRRAILAQAEAQKWDKRPEIAAAIERARTDVIFTSYLRAVATPPAGYPSEEEARKAYDANLSRFMLPRQYHLAKIFVALPPGATAQQSEATHKRAEEIARKARGNAFAAVARANSDDHATADKGGDIGWVGANQLIPEIAKAVDGMSDGEVSPPIQTNGGYLIVREIGTKPAGPEPFDQAKATIVASLRQQQTIALAQAYVDKLLAQKKAAVNEIALRGVVEGQ